MEQYQERMLAELKELNERVNKLSDFIGSKTYNELDENKRILLALQKNAMEQYAIILACRCHAEGIDDETITSI